MAITLSREALKAGNAGEKAVQVLDRLQGMQLARRLGKMVLLAAGIALGLMVFFWSQRPAHVPLYAGLDAKATAEATDLLRTAKIPFRIDPATGAISVPEDHIHDARLKLAGSGLTESGRLGLELMERDPGFGVSQFVETARYQHALETELARTISALRPVREARVHLAIPKPSAFTRQREEASASVVLDLRGGSTLERGQVDAVVHLVASSIPDLAPERVTVVDQSGRLLSDDKRDPEAALSAMQFEQVRRHETSFNQRIRELLEPLTGAGRVNAEVTIDMDFSVSEEARELYNADPRLRSEQVSENSSTAPGPQGIPGVTSNLPETAGDPELAQDVANATREPTETSRSATRNYELDRTLQHTRQPPGRIRRVTAAVLVDHVPRPGPDGATVLQPLSDAELQRVEALVRQAVGFDEQRGDVVSVMNAPFVHEAPGDMSPPPWWKLPQVRDIARLLLGAVVVLALLFGVVRPAIRQITGPVPAREKAATDPARAEVIEDEVPELAEDSATISKPAPIALPSDAYEDRVNQAREAVRADSKRVAQVVKGWLSDEASA
ncbi:flagellar basal-body MS-ring/collar protein FliF [Luteimonas sp. JM171]|uniref:flagellar basal-body MS-ring/collar protein FliF n=1 Tax=Luteimonas sp. JM171 TaxID=1896164 RepID=UPI000856A951|nr:flagellar basal-body MS-ring/collar protein FliF [Luteimonas sp. JM171]AOH37035.1 flagellar M-ring protein FliF [Luteimonas sp. JM171]